MGGRKKKRLKELVHQRKLQAWLGGMRDMVVVIRGAPRGRGWRATEKPSQRGLGFKRSLNLKVLELFKGFAQG